MALRRPTAALLLMVMTASAHADEVITVRPGFRDRFIIEDSTGRTLGSVRPLNDHMLLIEDPNGRDVAAIRGNRVDIRRSCGDKRASLACLLGEDDD